MKKKRTTEWKISPFAEAGSATRKKKNHEYERETQSVAYTHKRGQNTTIERKKWSTMCYSKIIIFSACFETERYVFIIFFGSTKPPANRTKWEINDVCRKTIEHTAQVNARAHTYTLFTRWHAGLINLTIFVRKCWFLFVLRWITSKAEKRWNERRKRHNHVWHKTNDRNETNKSFQSIWRPIEW